MGVGAGGHAVVIGGSMAGLLAARVLADHFAQVSVIERDHFPADPTYRAGVPQARHVHGLLVRGYQVLQALFPGLDGDLAAAEAPLLDWTADIATLGLAGWSVRYCSGLVSRFASRPLLDGLIRRHLSRYDNVRLVDDHQVVSLLPGERNTAVAGVRVRARRPPDRATERDIAADFVVDASGRSSRAPGWLAALGYEPPQETTINAFLGYASRWYQRPPDRHDRWRGLLIGTRAPDQTRGGVLAPIEGERWIVTLAGLGGDYPPTDDDAAFLDFARSLRSPLLYEAIRNAEPLTPIYGYRRTENCLRHYERLRRWPERFVLLGDAVCTFNPVYGQGMSVAAQGAQLLDRCLRQAQQARPRSAHEPRDLAGLARAFQHQVAALNATPWLMATGEDLRWASTQGGQPSAVTRLTQRYMDAIITLMARSPRASRAFMEVWHLLAPPATLFHPSLVALVAGQALTRSGRYRDRDRGHRELDRVVERPHANDLGQGFPAQGARRTSDHAEDTGRTA
jgi:2-polyprenyl-6-methoxyphenol hydroxylase-like FAD-dependent oxidoreductase